MHDYPIDIVCVLHNMLHDDYDDNFEHVQHSKPFPFCDNTLFVDLKSFLDFLGSTCAHKVSAVLFAPE